MKMTTKLELKESIDYGETNFNAILNDNKNYSQKKEDSQSFEQAGYSTTCEFSRMKILDDDC